MWIGMESKRHTRIGRVHVLTDEVLQQRFSHLDLARLAAQGGADVVQYREKRHRVTRHLVQTARAMQEILRSTTPRAHLVVNDRADVALAAQVGGLHLGRDDLEAEVARRIVGASVLLGGTANSVAEARQRFTQGFDYLGVGPIYGTTSKAKPAPPLGLEALSIIATESPVPVIAIGSITPERVPEVLQAGAHGIAVLSGVCCARDPLAAVARYREAVDAAEHSAPPATRGGADR
jgi:thiamine-phosphate pyrophosphorylase